MTNRSSHPPQSTAQSWLILSIGFAVLFVSGGSRFALGLLLKPMSEDLDWGRALVSLVGTLFFAVSACGQPLIGRLVDRINPLWIVSAGLFISGFGLILMVVVTSVWHVLLVYGIVYAIGNAALSLTVVGVMVMRTYGARRGLATSVAVSGMGLGQLVLVGAITLVLVSVGWRWAFGLLSATNALVLIGLVAIVRGVSYRVETASTTAPPVSPPIRDPQAHLFSRPTIRLLLVVYTICGFQDFFMSTHVVAFATDQGVPAVVAGNVLALMGFMGVIGVVATGALSDTFGPLLPTACCFLIRIGLFASIPFIRSDTGIIVFALLYGATFMVTAPLTIVFAEQAVGRTHMGWVTGILTMTHQIAGGVGALFGGGVFDRWGHYQHAFGLMFVLAFVALWAIWQLQRHMSVLPTGDEA